MGNRICLNYNGRQTSSSKKYKEEVNDEKVLEERSMVIKDSNTSERFLKHFINRGALDDLDSIFMVP